MFNFAMDVFYWLVFAVRFAFRLYLNRKLFYIYLISLLTHDSCLNSCLS